MGLVLRVDCALLSLLSLVVYCLLRTVGLVIDVVRAPLARRRHPSYRSWSLN